MEIAVGDLAGSLGGGGRYDGLIGMFSGEQIPACGFSLGLERIIVVMTERGMFPQSVQASGPDVLVTIFDQASEAESLRLSGELRDAGLRVELYPQPDKLGKQVKYASTRDAAFVAILGVDERARGEVTIKNMKTGDQQSLARAGLAAHLLSQV
jgi:histidyl-tRNA synthetase